MSNFLAVLNDCEENQEMTRLITIDLPYKDQIINGEFSVNDKSISELEKAFMTYGYLGIDSSDLAKEFVWRIGCDGKYFYQYFTNDDNEPCKFIVRKDIDKTIYCELKIQYPNSYTLYELGCRYDKHSLNYRDVVSSGNIKLLQWMRDNKIDISLVSDLYNRTTDINVLDWLYSQGMNNFYYGITKSLTEGNIEAVKWFFDKGFYPEYGDTMRYAVKSGNFELVKWLGSKKCPCDHFASSEAAENGYFDILKWLKNYGCPFNDNTVYTAIYAGHFDIVKWMREEKCSFEGEYLLYNAKRGGHMEIYNWLKDIGVSE